MSSLGDKTHVLPAWLWPESVPRRWIHGIGAFVLGGTLLVWGSIMAYGLLGGGESAPDSILDLLFGLAFASTVAVFTTLVAALPYALGSLAARSAQRPYWIVGACGMVGLMSLGFRVYVYGIVGGGQAFINMILHAIPFSSVVLAGWFATLVRSTYLAEDQSVSPVLVGTVGAAALLGAAGSVAGWVLRNSTWWMIAGGLPGLGSIGLGFWATRWARQENEAVEA